MKKNLYLLATILSCVTILFSSCSDDDDITNQSELGKEVTVDATADNKWVYVNLADGSSRSETIDPVSGLYNGDAEILVGGGNMGDIKNLKITISRVSEDSIKIVANDIKFNTMEIKELITGAKVTVDSINGKLGYKLIGGESVFETPEMNIRTTCAGSVVGKNINLDLKFKPGKMPMFVTTAYKGTIEKGSVDESAFNWDIAFHRWDVKTNNGSALETSETELENVKGIPTGTFVADVETDLIAVDRRLMMQSKIGYATGMVNKELSKWMDVNLNQMPPLYTPSNKVYVLKTAAGKCVLIKFTNYINEETKEKPYITFRYVSPEK